MRILFFSIAFIAAYLGSSHANDFTQAITYSSKVIINDTTSRIDSCSCHPSLPIEIGAAALVWGFPAYWIVEPLLHIDKDEVFNASGIGIPISYFLLMYSLGPTSEWTSNCEGSYWNALWIGLAVHLPTTLIYATILRENNDSGHIHKFVFRDYLVVSVLPSIISALWYNTFLHPKDHQQEQSMMLFPTIGGRNTALNFVLRF